MSISSGPSCVALTACSLYSTSSANEDIVNELIDSAAESRRSDITQEFKVAREESQESRVKFVFPLHQRPDKRS